MVRSLPVDGGLALAKQLTLPRLSKGQRQIALIISSSLSSKPMAVAEHDQIPVIPRAAQRSYIGALQMRDLVLRTDARAAGKVPDQRCTMKDAAAHPG